MSKKSEAMFNAITNIDDDLIEQAEAVKNNRLPIIKIISVAAAFAAVIAIVLFVNSWLNNKLPISQVPLSITNDFAVSLAEYPEAAQFAKEGTSDFNKWFSEQQRKFTNEKIYVDSVTSFTKNSISVILKDDESNKLYSPINVYLALSMLAETTDSSTRQEILNILSADRIETVREYSRNLWSVNYQDDSATKCILANSLWMNRKIKYNKELTDSLVTYYHASSFSGDMDSPEYSKAFQYWLNEQTDGFLSEYTEGLIFDSQTVLALASAINYKAKWNSEFLPEKTHEGVFHSNQKDISCRYMNEEVNNIYYWGEKFSAVSKKFGNASGEMWFILPDIGVSVNELLKDEQAVDFICHSQKHKYSHKKSLIVNLSVPKFDVSSEIDLAQPLQGLGIEGVFNQQTADFSPLVENSDGVYVDKMTHNVRVSVDEQGCQAVAYTVMMMAGSAMPPDETIDFILDRPFIFVINGIDGLPLFVGIVNSPLQG